MKRKPNDTTGLSTRLASVLDAVTAEHRSCKVLEQIYTDDDELDTPVRPALADLVKGERMAARCRASVDRVRRTLYGDEADIVLAEGSSDGIIADPSNPLDTARVIAMGRADLEQCALTLGVTAEASLLSDDQLRDAVLARRAGR